MGDLVEMFESIGVNGVLGKKHANESVVSFYQLLKRKLYKIFSFIDFYDFFSLLLIFFYERVFF